MRLLLLATVLAVTASAQPSQRTIAVIGVGDASAALDRAVLSVSFTTEGASADEALTQHEVEVERIRQLLAERDVPEDDIHVDQASVGPSGGGMGMRGGSSDDGSYSVRRQMTITVDDLDAVPGLVAALSSDSNDDVLAVQLRNVNVTYVLSDDADLRRTALREAVADARQRAELMAEAAGVELGPVIDIAESGAASFGGDMGGFQAMMMEAMQQEMGMGGAGGEQTVRSRVIVSYEVR